MIQLCHHFLSHAVISVSQRAAVIIGMSQIVYFYNVERSEVIYEITSP
jgi:hypothetical protein